MQSLEELSREIESIRQEIREGAAKFATPEAFYEFRKSFLDNKAGKIGHLMKEMRNVPKEDKAAYGKNVNVLRDWAQEHFKDMENAVRAKQLEMRYEREKIDVTEPAVRVEEGRLHPVTQVKYQLIDIFASMGFEVYEGTEIETDYYNFTALNTPQDHPARDMQDTFYLSPEFLLRTQTSAGQIHVMESKKPPIKIVSPGKVFRSDDDATHSPMFTQMEGLVVDNGITLCDLKGMLDVFVKLRRQGLPSLQGHRLDRGPGRRRRQQEGPGELRNRFRRVLRLRFRPWSGAHRHAEVRHQQHQAPV